jgi:hypothetical protein
MGWLSWVVVTHHHDLPNEQDECTSHCHNALDSEYIHTRSVKGETRKARASSFIKFFTS